MKTSASTTALNPSTPTTSQKQKSGPSAAQTELTPTPSPSRTGGELGQTSPQQDYLNTPPVREGKGVGLFPLRIRGVLTQLNVSGDCEFRAQRSTGEPSQKVLSKSGDAKLYETTGRKPMMVAHLTTRADASDPVADLYDQLDAMAAKHRNAKKPAKIRGRKLLDEENALVTLSQKERKVQMVLTIDLEKTPDYSNELIVLMQKVSQCFLINQAFLRPQSR